MHVSSSVTCLHCVEEFLILKAHQRLFSTDLLTLVHAAKLNLVTMCEHMKNMTMATSTMGAIAMHPTGNIQGGYYFISLDAGHQINRRDWTPLPMPNEVIQQVHCLARRAKANKSNLRFTNLNNEDLDILYANIEQDDDDMTDTDDEIGLTEDPTGVENDSNNNMMITFLLTMKITTAATEA